MPRKRRVEPITNRRVDGAVTSTAANEVSETWWRFVDFINFQLTVVGVQEKHLSMKCKEAALELGLDTWPSTYWIGQLLDGRLEREQRRCAIRKKMAQSILPYQVSQVDWRLAVDWTEATPESMYREEVGWA